MEASVWIRKELLGEESEAVLESYLNFGNLYYAKGQYSKALEFSKKALDGFSKIYDDNHPKISEISRECAKVYL